MTNGSIDERTLCGFCIRDYKEANYKIRFPKPLKFGRCDKCERKGVEVIIERRLKDAHGK